MTVFTPIGVALVSIVFIISWIYSCIYPEKMMMYNNRDFNNTSDNDINEDDDKHN